MDYIELSRNLKMIRHNLGLSSESFAKLLGVPRDYVSNWENYENNLDNDRYKKPLENIRLCTLQKVATLSGRSVSWLIGDSSTSPADLDRIAMLDTLTRYWKEKEDITDRAQALQARYTEAAENSAKLADFYKSLIDK